VLRRNTGPVPVVGSRLRFADLELDQETHEAWRDGFPLRLTPTEFRLLRYLMLNPRRVLSKFQILDHVWDYDFDGDAHVVENYISYLRKRVDAHGPPLIHTVRGVGYCLRAPSADAPGPSG
jgi:two-component system, OmpR family, response regulator